MDKVLTTFVITIEKTSKKIIGGGVRLEVWNKIGGTWWS
jgi:hypothetical protein